MSAFYQDLVTKKSFEVLKEIRQEFDFILIGGWAIFVYTESLKSKDIDIIVDYGQLEVLKEKYDVVKNQRLKKYEAKIENIDIDIYLPFFSDLGFPVEEVQNHTQSRQGFVLPVPEILLIFKAVTYEERKGSTKGQKDLVDIFSLLAEADLDWERYHELIADYNLQDISQNLKEIVDSADPIPELDLLNHQLAKLKSGVLEKL